MDEKPYSIIEKAINEIYTKYGIRIKHCDFIWIDMSTGSKKFYILHTSEINAEIS